jgi:aminoglycoside 6-adenylyltransferase
VDHEEMIGRVTRWAAADENIRAVVLNGSVARGDHDSLSDLDVELYVRDPSLLLDNRDWYAQFGDVLAFEELPNPGWIPTRLLYLVDGKVDFAIGDVAALGAFPSTRPFRVLVDKDDRADEVVRLDPASGDARPTSGEFEECVHWFAAAALMEAKLIVRQEPWLAKLRDHDLKTQLLRMVEWDHRCRYGWDAEIWYGGKRIGDWADPDIRSDLERCWAGVVPDEAIPALRASMRLFERMATRTGTALGFALFHHERVHTEVDRIIAVSRPPEGAASFGSWVSAVGVGVSSVMDLDCPADAEDRCAEHGEDRDGERDAV